MAEGIANFVFLNGPPGCGKDSIAKSLIKNSPFHSYRMAFADPLKSGVHTLLGLDPNPLAFEHCKNEIRAEFGYRTPRSAYQYFGEQVMKPMFGKGVFGKTIANMIERGDIPGRERRSDRVGYNYGYEIIYITDLGFFEELVEVASRFDKSASNYVGPNRFHVVNVYREGTNFSGDTRKYITANDLSDFELSDGISFHTLENNKSILAAADQLHRMTFNECVVSFE